MKDKRDLKLYTKHVKGKRKINYLKLNLMQFLMYTIALIMKEKSEEIWKSQFH